MRPPEEGVTIIHSIHSIFNTIYLVVGDDPVADELQDEDEEPSVEREHSNLSTKLLHDKTLSRPCLLFQQLKFLIIPKRCGTDAVFQPENY